MWGPPRVRKRNDCSSDFTFDDGIFYYYYFFFPKPIFLGSSLQITRSLQRRTGAWSKKKIEWLFERAKCWQLRLESFLLYADRELLNISFEHLQIERGCPWEEKKNDLTIAPIACAYRVAFGGNGVSWHRTLINTLTGSFFYNLLGCGGNLDAKMVYFEVWCNVKKNFAQNKTFSEEQTQKQKKKPFSTSKSLYFCDLTVH